MVLRSVGTMSEASRAPAAAAAAARCVAARPYAPGARAQPPAMSSRPVLTLVPL